MFELKVTAHFSAAHSLRNYQGKCERLHGHNWRVEVVLRAPELGPAGMIMDFQEFRERLEGVLEGFDHKNLTDIKPFDKLNPTTENIAREIYARFAEGMPDGVKVARVTAYETESSGASYYETE